MQNYHILPTDTGWESKEEHGDRALLKASTKDAIVHQAAQYLDGKTGTSGSTPATVVSKKNVPIPAVRIRPSPRADSERASLRYPAADTRNWRNAWAPAPRRSSGLQIRPSSMGGMASATGRASSLRPSSDQPR